MKRLLSATCLLVFSLSPLFAQNNNVQRWEYFKLYTCEQNDLNKYGDEGWELAGVTKAENSCELFTFKRPKPVNAPKYVEPTKQKVLAEKEKPTCQLTLAQAPKFRGIRLGMSVKEMLSLFPGSEQSDSVIGELQRISKNYGSGGFRFDFERYGRMKETMVLFDGIQSYGFEVFDDRVVSYSVVFSDYQKELDWSWTVPAWQEKLTETFRLPVTENWGKNVKNDYYADSMRCEGFTISSSVHIKSARFAITERLQSAPYEQVLQRREAAFDKVRQSFKIVP